MPPKRQRSGTTITNGAPRSSAAKKRKNAMRSDDDDSDFETRPFQSALAHSKPSHRSKDWERNQQESMNNYSHGRNGTGTVTNGHEKENRKTSAQSMITSTTATSSSSVSTNPTISRTKTTAPIAKNGVSVTEQQQGRSTTPLPPSPERTPSRDRTYTQRPVSTARATKPTTTRPNQQNRNVESSSTPRKAVPRPDLQYTPDRTTDMITAIPMRETPTINKNKVMRSGSRRSSFAMRGKRASSIGNGASALPHPSVESKNFYRHISADDPPPIRMKVLMSWCARRAIDSKGQTINKETGEARSAAGLKIASLIQEEVLSDLLAGKFSLSWYSRPLDDENTLVKKPKKPHVQNVKNRKKLEEYEAQMVKLRKEDEAWSKVITSYNNYHASLLDSGPQYPPGNAPIIVPASFADDIDLNLLTADERSLWEKYIMPTEKQQQPSASTLSSSSSSSSSLSTSLSSKSKGGATDSLQSTPDKKAISDIMKSIETEVDDLRNTLYAASRFDKVARQYTDQVLEQVAMALDERQRPRLPEPVLQQQQQPPSTATVSSSSQQQPNALIPQNPPMRTVLSPDIMDDPHDILRALSRL
ncbi:hypothetical protein BG004_003269, partial [Podila humilis]